MKKRTRLISKGKVQKVGYRDAVKDIASKFGVTGYVENMRNSDVQIVCELDEELIPKFVEAIKIKKDFINVEDVKIVEESSATGEFEYFDIKYGRLEEEFGDRAGTMILYLGGIQGSVNKVGEKVDIVGEKVDSVGEKVDSVGEKVDSVGEKVDSVGEKVDSVGEKVDSVGENVESMHEDMNENFEELDTKYHIISETMINMNKSLVTTQEQLTKAVDKLTFIVDRFIEDEKSKSRNDKEAE